MVYYYTEKASFLEKEIKLIDKSELLLKLKELFKSKKIVAIDVETTGLNPLLDKVVMLQLGFGNIQIVIDTRSFDFSLLKHFLERKSVTFVGHNIKFDYNMLKQYGIVLKNVYDTMLAETVIYNGRYSQKYIRKYKRFSLAGVYYHYFDKKVVKTVRNEFLHWGDNPFSTEQIHYGALDVVYPLEIRKKQSHWIRKYKLQRAINIENRNVLSVGDMEYNGIHLDSKKWLAIYEKYNTKIKVTKAELDHLLIQQSPKYEQKAYQLSLFEETIRERFTAVNWDSDKQVYKILTEEFNIFPVDKDGKASSGTPALLLLIDKPDFVLKLIQYRKEAKVLSSFGKKFLDKFLQKDNRIHATFNQIIDTGRMSSRKPNMQQIPRDAVFREAFTAPKGKKIIAADYGSQESRIMADLASDKNFIKFFKEGGGDVHSFIATRLFSVAFKKEFIVTETNENKAYRQKGKVLNYLISFGGSAYTLAKTLQIPLEEGEELVNSFFAGFPDLNTFFKTQRKFALDNGYIRTNNITNRIRWIPEWAPYQTLKAKPYEELTKFERSKKARLRGRIERKAQNTPIQGTAGDMTKTALILIRDKLLSLNIIPTINACIKIVNVVHDEIILEATEEMAETAAKILKESMEKAAKYYLKYLEIPAQPEIGPHWIH